MEGYTITTVTAAATSFNLTTLANVKADIELRGTEKDPLINRIIPKASAAIAKWCNRVFARQTYQEVWRPPTLSSGATRVVDGIKPLTVLRWPLVSVTSIVEDGTLLVAGTDYELDLEHDAIYRLDGEDNPVSWPSAKRTIVYVAGYILPANGVAAASVTIPADLEDAAVRLINGRYQGGTRDPYLKSESLPGVITQEFWVPDNEGNLPPDIKDLLEDYRVPVLP